MRGQRSHPLPLISALPRETPADSQGSRLRCRQTFCDPLMLLSLQLHDAKWKLMQNPGPPVRGSPCQGTMPLCTEQRVSRGTGLSCPGVCGCLRRCPDLAQEVSLVKSAPSLTPNSIKNSKKHVEKLSFPPADRRLLELGQETKFSFLEKRPQLPRASTPRWAKAKTS